MLLLLKDLGVWMFWNISPWTIVFLVVGLWIIVKAHAGTGSRKKKK